jgi:hypothetical protein
MIKLLNFSIKRQKITVAAVKIQVLKEVGGCWPLDQKYSADKRKEQKVADINTQ